MTDTEDKGVFNGRLWDDESHDTWKAIACDHIDVKNKLCQALFPDASRDIVIYVGSIVNDMMETDYKANEDDITKLKSVYLRLLQARHILRVDELRAKEDDNATPGDDTGTA